MNQLSDLNFQQKNGDWINIPALSLKFFSLSEAISECQIEFEIDATQYQVIEQKQAFNLTPEIKTPHVGQSFESDRPIHLELLLKPDLLPTLLVHAQTDEEAANYLSKLSQQYSSPETDDSPATVHPLLQSESWLCLSVKQQRESGEVGFNTFWHSIRPALLQDPETTSDQLAEGIVNSVKEWTEANLAEATQTATTQFLQAITETFEDLIDRTVDNLPDEEDTDGTLFDVVAQFFENDDWTFATLPDTHALRLSFRGDRGQWNCYAQAREEQQQIVFYSICPIALPEHQWMTVAEFITRANYGMIIGNFELDFEDGEVRYKTSIDIEGGTLTSEMVKQLVYVNVLTMDRYLPGIVAIAQQNLDAKEAIALVESEP
ncbi:MAG: YbjN domain-containing protein [Elainellaceae cyanobacterium]